MLPSPPTPDVRRLDSTGGHRGDPARWSVAAVLGAVLALPCPPAGIACAAVGLHATRRGRRRGRALAVVALAVSVAWMLLCWFVAAHLGELVASVPRAAAAPVSAPSAPADASVPGTSVPSSSVPAASVPAAAPSPSGGSFTQVDGDVSVLGCHRDAATGTEVVELSARNSGTAPTTYTVGLELRDASAATVGAAEVDIPDVQPGQEVTGTTAVHPRGTSPATACGIAVVAETTSYAYPAG